MPPISDIQTERRKEKTKFPGLQCPGICAVEKYCTSF
jgi:hypothetical protein